ncbi:uncharacterized protein LOC113492543 isoform X2 [Trichoplusia ni]|nr:uncharacterized protein LOC113492543 isoform X2 [Trichoplusia ni]
MVVNVHNYVKQTWPTDEYPYKTSIIQKTASILGIGEASVYRIIKEYATTGNLQSPSKTKKRVTFSEKLDEFDKQAIRKKVHGFYMKSEIPTLKKVLQAVNDDKELPNFKRSTFQKILKHLKFKYIKRQGMNALIDRDDIRLWRKNYLRKIKKYRTENRPIFYMDETWVNAVSGHTGSKTSVDNTITSKRQAFMEGLSTGAKNPTSKGRRLIVVHIGNENGFVEGVDEVFESKNTGDYPESMDANRFEQWFENILPKLGEHAVVVLDNAPYHSRRQEKTPTTAWSKTSIQEWLRNKELSYDEKDVKSELLEIVNNVKPNNQRYAVDELAKNFKVEVLRLPPYHFELNPIELVWADIKGHVARNNTTFKFEDVKKLLQEGIQRISPD